MELAALVTSRHCLAKRRHPRSRVPPMRRATLPISPTASASLQLVHGGHDRSADVNGAQRLVRHHETRSRKGALPPVLDADTRDGVARDIDRQGVNHLEVAADVSPVARRWGLQQRGNLLVRRFVSQLAGHPDAELVLTGHDVGNNGAGVVVVRHRHRSGGEPIGMASSHRHATGWQQALRGIDCADMEKGVVAWGVRGCDAGTPQADVASPPTGQVAVDTPVVVDGHGGKFIELRVGEVASINHRQRGSHEADRVPAVPDALGMRGWPVAQGIEVPLRADPVEELRADVLGQLTYGTC